MTKSLQQLPAFNLCTVILVAITAMGRCNGNLQQIGQQSSSTLQNLAENGDNHGEVCDPTTQIPCKSQTMQCIWSPIDMLYKCSKDGLGSKRNYLRKKRTKRKLSLNEQIEPVTQRVFPVDMRVANYEEKLIQNTRLVRNVAAPSINQSDHTTKMIPPAHMRSKREENDSNSNPPIVDNPSTNDTNTMTQNASINASGNETGNPSVNETGNPSGNETGNANRNETVNANGKAGTDLSQNKTSGQSKKGGGGSGKSTGAQKRQALIDDNILPDGYTLEVPKYSGVLTWDGETEDSEPCKTKAEMAKGLQLAAPMASKLKWIDENADEICNFKKFFHCTIESGEGDELEMTIHDDGTEVDDEIDDDEITEPVCRCYDSSMAVVRGKCYIPADFGIKSACGDVTAPYPIRPWEGAPTLRPSCTPNSDCKESPYWFGKRCACRWNAKWNSLTHTCDDASKTVKSILLLVISFFIPFLSSHITVYFL